MFSKLGRYLSTAYNNYTNFKTYDNSEPDDIINTSNQPENVINYENGTDDEMQLDEDLPYYNEIHENINSTEHIIDNESNFFNISSDDSNVSISSIDTVIVDINMDYYIKLLNEKGYVIIPNVYDKNEVENYWNEFDKWRANVPDLDYLHNIIDGNGIFKHHQVGHQRFAWEARTNPKILAIFKKLWNTNELVTSFDGCCFYPSYYKNNVRYWTHSDQSSMKSGLNCYQSFLSLTDNRERTFIVYEGTHNYHQHYFETMGIEEPRDWNIIDKDYLMNNHLSKQKFLNVKAGDLVIWDSRTFHQNTCGSINCNEERLIQYLCYLPKHNEKMMKNKKNKEKNFLKKNEQKVIGHIL